MLEIFKENESLQPLICKIKNGSLIIEIPIQAWPLRSSGPWSMLETM